MITSERVRRRERYYWRNNNTQVVTHTHTQICLRENEEREKRNTAKKWYRSRNVSKFRKAVVVFISECVLVFLVHQLQKKWGRNIKIIRRKKVTVICHDQRRKRSFGIDRKKRTEKKERLKLMKKNWREKNEEDFIKFFCYF